MVLDHVQNRLLSLDLCHITPPPICLPKRRAKAEAGAKYGAFAEAASADKEDGRSGVAP
jgi:hypothetical protein